MSRTTTTTIIQIGVRSVKLCRGLILLRNSACHLLQLCALRQSHRHHRRRPRWPSVHLLSHHGSVFFSNFGFPKDTHQKVVVGTHRNDDSVHVGDIMMSSKEDIMMSKVGISGVNDDKGNDGLEESMIVGTHVADNYCKDPPSYHPTSELVEKLVNPETNNSRPALVEVKNFIRNWIGTKTVASQLWITSARVRKLLINWLFGHCNWLVFVLMFLKQFMYYVRSVWRISPLSKYHRLWMGISQLICCCLSVSLFQFSSE